MRRLKTVVIVFFAGFRDGLESPYELGSGLTFSDWSFLNSVYDAGVNAGQLVRAPLNHQRMEDKWISRNK